ncbi:MAG: hypothetical protein HFF42_06785 [Lawsonibacter sp.]|nr:hypothetical protein [Lawsonibacter sp.]
MKTIKKRYIVLVAALIALALSCTAMASGVLGETFGLWLGDRKVALDELTPVAFDLEGFLAEYPTGIVDGDRVFRDAGSFTRATGMTLPGAEELQMTDILLSVSKRWRTGHLCMTVGTGGGEAQMNGMFLLEGHAQEMYGYGVENTRADEVYEYAEGRKAYFIKGDEIKARLNRSGGPGPEHGPGLFRETYEKLERRVKALLSAQTKAQRREHLWTRNRNSFPRRGTSSPLSTWGRR